jgi:hypothetical protein
LAEALLISVALSVDSSERLVEAVEQLAGSGWQTGLILGDGLPMFEQLSFGEVLVWLIESMNIPLLIHTEDGIERLKL